MQLWEKFCMLKMNSGWIKNAYCYLIKHCLFSLMKPCSLATLSLPTCDVLRGSFQSPLLPASWSPQQSAHWPWRAPRRPTISLHDATSAMWKLQPPLHSLAQAWPFGEAARTAPGGEPGGAFCQNQQVAMANSSSEGRLVFPAVKTANRGGSQCCPC